MKGILGYVEEDVDSFDFIGDSRYVFTKLVYFNLTGQCVKRMCLHSRRFGRSD